MHTGLGPWIFLSTFPLPWGYKKVPPCSAFYGGSTDQTQVLLFAQPASTRWMIFPAPLCFYEPQDSHSPQSQSRAPADGIEDRGGVSHLVFGGGLSPLSLLFAKFE